MTILFRYLGMQVCATVIGGTSGAALGTAVGLIGGTLQGGNAVLKENEKRELWNKPPLGPLEKSVEISAHAFSSAISGGLTGAMLGSALATPPAWPVLAYTKKRFKS